MSRGGRGAPTHSLRTAAKNNYTCIALQHIINIIYFKVIIISIII